jgi:hypothetical protein
MSSVFTEASLETQDAKNARDLRKTDAALGNELASRGEEGAVKLLETMINVMKLGLSGDGAIVKELGKIPTILGTIMTGKNDSNIPAANTTKSRQTLSQMGIGSTMGYTPLK